MRGIDAQLGRYRDLREDGTWPAARSAFLQSLPPFPRCHRCNGIITGRVDVDHDPPYALTGNHDSLWPAHPECNQSAGGQFGAERRRLRALQAEEGGWGDRSPRRTITDPSTAPSAPPTDPMWAVPWLGDLLDVPEDATWPRYQSAPHPDAVSSLGVVFEKWVTAQGRTLRWWQRMAARRLLEINDAGELCWAEILLTVSRQSGKSVLLRELLGWRLIEGAEEFGEPQTLLHIASNEAIAQEVQRPFRIWAKSHDDTLKVREANGNVGVEVLADGSRWLVRASKAVYGLSASVAAVDEAWAIAAAVIDDGLVPTMLEREQAQLLLLSTAHRRATGLVLDRRAACLKNLAEPEDVLLLEWSADPDLDDDDEIAWRQASPHWSDRRRKLVARQLEQARSGTSVDPDEPDPMHSFRSQYLNLWPSSKVRAKRGQPLFAEGLWDSLRAGTDVIEREDSALIVAVEDSHGDRAAAVAAVELTDGRIAVWGQEFYGRDLAISFALDLASNYDEGARATVLIGASMASDPALSGATVRVVPVGIKEFRTGLPLLRSVVSGGRVVHDGGEELARQVANVRVMEGPSGLSLVGGVRADMLRCLVWATQASAIKPWVIPQVY